MTFDEAHLLIKRGDIVGLRRALDEGLDSNTTHRYGWTLLMVAASTGNTSIGRLLIERGVELDRRNIHRVTALSLAVQSGHSSFVKVMLEAGASLDCHPHGNSLDIFLDWAEQYTPASREQIQKIRMQFDAARDAKPDSSHP